MGTVLLVEDDIECREVVRRIVNMAGHKVLEAADADEAYRVTRGHTPEVVVLDLHLPGSGDGIDIISGLRARGIDPLVIIYAGEADDERLNAWAELGIFDIIEKPSDLVYLANRIEQAVDLAKKQTSLCLFLDEVIERSEASLNGVA